MKTISSSGVRIFVSIAVVTTVVFTALGLALSWWTKDSRELVLGTHRSIAEVRRLLAHVVDAETGARGYFFTRQPEFLEPWHLALDDIPRHLIRLKAMSRDHAEQLERLGEIEALVDAKLAILKRNIEALSRNELTTAMIDREVMGRFRVAAAEFEQNEEALLLSRTEVMEQRFYFAIAGILFAGIASLVAILFSAWYLRNAATRYESAERLAQQAQKMEAIGQLSGGIAHDFNNLLQVVSANIELALPQLRSNEPALGHLQTAMIGLAKGASLTRQLLAFARKQPLRPEPTDVQALMAESVVLLDRTLGENYQVELIAATGVWRAMVDPVLLQNATLNLALNARDAMPDGGHLTIEVANAALSPAYAFQEPDVAPGDYVMLAVSDTGCGMPPDVVARVFEPFFTTKEKGNGLGLAMVFGFVKQSGGHIKFYSEVGHGTTVKIFLPRTDQVALAREAPKLGKLRGNGETILVVEDDDAVRAGVVAQLSGLGYRVVAAADGESAAEALARDSRIALLITDVVLRGSINGRRVADAARRSRPNLPVIYMSGYTENAVGHHGQIDDGVVLLTKPFTSADLGKAIAQALPAPREERNDTAAVAGPSLDNNEIGATNRAPAPCNILVAEDDEKVRAGMVMLLKRMGHAVTEAGSAQEALDIIAAGGAVEVLITDLGLPDRDGIALATEARQRRPDLDIIVSTGHSVLPPEAANVPGDRALQLLVKPYSSQELASAIRAMRPAAPVTAAMTLQDARPAVLAGKFHDLRSPLQALSLFVGMLGETMPPEDAPLVKNINACVLELQDRLTDLVDACEDCQKVHWDIER